MIVSASDLIRDGSGDFGCPKCWATNRQLVTPRDARCPSCATPLEWPEECARESASLASQHRYWRVPRFFSEASSTPIVVVIGGGPSLTRADVARVFMARARPASVRVIAINDAYRLAPWADILYGCDWPWWVSQLGARAFSGGDRVTMEDPYHTWPAEPARFGLRVLKCTGAFGFEEAQTAVRHGYSSGAQALQIAAHMGAKRILLLGFDCKAATVDGAVRHHWLTSREVKQPPYGKFVMGFEALAPELSARGIDVVNCSPDTALTMFRRAPLSDAITETELASTEAMSRAFELLMAKRANGRADAGSF